MQKLKNMITILGLLILLFVPISYLTYTFINNQINPPYKNESESECQSQPILYYKTIPVIITDIKNQYYNSIAHSYSVTIAVKSQEYGLESEFTVNGAIMKADDYAYDAYNGNLHIGDTIYCEMDSYMQDNKVTSRDLNRLVKEDDN